MSEEEKKAIKVIQEIINYLSNDKSGFDSYDLYKTDIDTLITIQNLIKKQQELNEEHQKINGELRIKVKELEENLNNSISKDTIKELKEKLQNELKYIGCENKDKPGDESCKKCFNSYRSANFVYCYAYHQIKLLNKILGE